MFAFLKNARKGFSLIFPIFIVLFVAACQPSSMSSGPTINTSKPVRVALLIPGESSSAGDNIIARSLENAARLAISDLEGVQIDLRVYRTSGNAEKAASVAVAAVNDGAQIILGPLYGESANAVGLALSNKNINILAFSNKPSIAGGNVFVLGNTFQNTAERIVSYSVNQGRRNVMIVHGADNVSEEAGRDALVQAANRNGATITGVPSFEMSQQGVINAIPNIAAQARNSGTDAILFASGTEGALPLLTQLLPENGINTETTQFIGLTRWDIPTATLSLPGVQGAWFALPDPGLSNRYIARYSAAFGEPPHPISGLAYDGIAAIGALVKSGNSNALSSAALTQSSGFVGVNGVFRLLPDGTNQRGLAIAQVQENQVIVIDPAPRSFSGSGF
ncbi:penicillin-binding protein activator [Falsihalocynthiibacter arcticus]|uniref:ABC transporter substrate-binding protein n=1 Tax=Falsihalocynthiibacter arcticus TaxID=1579316 RepID=A0A126UZJ3_9RHOB|nr:penicillin-binding protein activator [Falsihalocynthiibacter arcticus]AML51464.1 ABC transporter substrate-binding protein [Falsihalocynthiibacter arcticus]